MNPTSTGGLRLRGRRRGRPRSGELRAIPRRRHDLGSQRHHREDLPARHRERTCGRLPREDGPDHPHVTDDIKRRIREAAEGSDVCLVEVGGTVGDIEDALSRGVAPVRPRGRRGGYPLRPRHPGPVLENGEQKTKPTQHSVKEVRSIGLQPDVIVGRCENRLEPETRRSRCSVTFPPKRCSRIRTSKTSTTSR